ncbi:nitroreductase family protein [Frankia sp. AgKG'84/4]|uniref:nitroreductase family protein n=1 Tax=Frankia sp. AgKG'84/4 TaxID=573490 RepID=UPI0020106292|nr:nitroreductase family protein [Frankia sp. AgKG'84/4]MCL9792775.1 nitroreductase family protein [Frankia sp. AgKG'84/4]
MDVDTLLTTTRSVRRKLDLDRPVEPEAITECLRIAIQAPAAGALLSSIRWLVIRDQATRQAVAAHVREPARISQARYGHLVSPAVLASGQHLVEVLDRVPVFVLAAMIGSPGAEGPSANAFYGSVYPAIWSFQLALRSRGLGTTITAYHLNGHEADVAALLDIPDDVTQVALLPVAYLTTNDFRPAARPSVESITYYERWECTAH